MNVIYQNTLYFVVFYFIGIFYGISCSMLVLIPKLLYKIQYKKKVWLFQNDYLIVISYMYEQALQ